jgi:hypothetical protein
MKRTTSIPYPAEDFPRNEQSGAIFFKRGPVIGCPKGCILSSHHSIAGHLFRGILALVSLSAVLECCTSPTSPGTKHLGYFDTLPVYCGHPPCTDTLSGWVPFGPDQGKTPYDSSHFVEVKALGRTLFARNTHGDIYYRPLEGKWHQLDLGEQAGSMDAMFPESPWLYLLTNSGKIFKLDELGNKSFVEQVPSSLTCPLPGTAPCYVSKIFRYKGKFLIEGTEPYTDSTFPRFKDSLINYSLLLGQNGQWERMRWQNGIRPPLNLSFRRLWLHGDSILGASYEDGIWIYDGARWDSIAKPHLPRFGDTAGIDSLTLFKWGGVAVFQGSIYASPWTPGLYRLEGSELKKITLKAVTNKGDTIVSDGLLNYGLDTLCGYLIEVHGMQYWKPGMLGWTRTVDTTQSFAVKGFNYSIASSYSMTRIGDSVFAAHEAPLLGKKDSIPGGIALFNLRDAPWCPETWKRGQEDRSRK